MSEGRVVHLEVRTHLDGRSEVSVTLTETPGGDFVIAVRPKGRHIEYTGLLSDVVGIVAARHAKALVASRGIKIPKPRKAGDSSL